MICLAFTVLFFAASAAATGYIDGREYIYQYNDAIYTGFPKANSQEAGYVYNLKLIVQPQGDSAIFKVDDAKKAQFNAEFEDTAGGPHTYTGLPVEAETLTRPFRVTRKSGIVTQFEVGADEPSFSVNMKRGIVSLFNLNFGQLEVDMKDNEILRQDSDAHYYKVYEESPVGDCETTYVIEHHPYDDFNNIVLNVTKVRDYHKCKMRPNQLYGREYHGYNCGRNQYDKSHTLHGNAYYKYSIRGDRGYYVIEKISIESETAYTPYPMKGGRVATNIRRTLELIREGPVTTKLKLPGKLVPKTSLMYAFDFQRDFKGHIDLRKPHFLYDLTGRKVPLDDVRRQMDDLLNAYMDESYAEKLKDRNFPAKFVELLRSAATLSFSDFEDLYMAYGNFLEKEASPEQELARSLFMDIIVNIGTNPAILFAKQLIDQKKARHSEAEFFIREGQFHIKEVSEVLLEKYQEICESEFVKKRTQLHLACIHALVNIVYDNCVARYHPDDLQHQITKSTCPHAQAVKYFYYVARLYDQATNDQVKMSLLQAAGKLGVKEAIPYILPYVKGINTQNRLQRDNAIWSMQNIGWKDKEKIRGLLIPLLYNQSEPTELRISAFTVLLQYQPALSDVEAMARAIKYDPDDDLKSYVYSAFKYIGSSTHLCDRNQSYVFQYALRILEEVKDEFEAYDYSKSKLTFFGGFDPEYNIGGSIRWIYYMHNNGWFPRKMYLAFENTLGGLSVLESGYSFRQYGLEKFLDKIFGPEGTFGRKSIFDLFKKRGKRNVGDAKKELDEIMEKMNLPIYEYDKIEGEIFFNYLTHKTQSFYFNESTFEKFFKDGRFVIPNIPADLQNIPEFLRQRFMLSIDKFYVMPTESGIPMFFDYKQPIYFYHKNKESSFRVEPGFFLEDRDGQWPTHVTLETDGHVALDKNLIANMGLIILFDQVYFGGGINRRETISLPLNLKLDLDVKENTLKTLWTPVASHEVYHFKYETFTFVDSYTNTVPEVLENGYKPVRKDSRQDVSKHLFHDALGLGIDIKADYENQFNDIGSIADFALKRDFFQLGYYLFTNPNFEPYYVDVQFSVANEAATREVGVDFTYQSLEDNWIIPQFAEENFEDYDMQREERGPTFTCVLKTDVRATGNKERRIHAITTLTRDLMRTFYKLNFFYERTPFTSSETDPLKICASSYIRYPNYDMKRLFTMDTIGLDHTVNTEMKVNFGENCNSDQKIEIKGLIQKSEEELELERQREQPYTPENKNEYSRWYHRCLKEESAVNEDPCVEYFDLVTLLHKYTLNITHENLSSTVLNEMYRLENVLKYFMMPHMDNNEIAVENTPDEVIIDVIVHLQEPIAEIRVRKPASITNYHNVPVPFSGFCSFPYFEEVITKKSFSDVYCGIEKDEVITFDRFKHNLPPLDCYKIISKDCSPQGYFTVLGTNIKHARYKTAVKIFLGDHKIEALPISEDSEIIVRVDGQKILVGNNEPYLHKDGDEIVFYISFRSYFYMFHSEKYGLIVTYDGDTISVQVSAYYKAKLCGLCGNYNGQKLDGYNAGGGCYYKNGEDYINALVIPSDTCTAPPKPEPICNGEGGLGCYRLRTKVVPLNTGKVPQTCFSTEPVSECTIQCQSPGTVSRKLSFHCLASSDDFTKSLLRERENRVLHELRRKSRDHETIVEVPDGCYKK